MENGNNSYGGFIDTGQWKLIIGIAADGMKASMRNLDDGSESIMFEKSWDPDSPDILRNIESTVYDNPRVLDDFATEIIVTTPKALWVPSEFMEEEDAPEKYFNCVYDAEEEDLFIDPGDGETCVYTLVPGLNSFLRRTLPGSRIYSHLSLLKTEAEKLAMSKPLIYIDIRERHADIAAFDGDNFRSAAVQEWRSPSDIAYHVSLAADAFDFNPGETAIRIKGNPDVSASTAEVLGKIFKNVEKI